MRLSYSRSEVGTRRILHRSAGSRKSVKVLCGSHRALIGLHAGERSELAQIGPMQALFSLACVLLLTPAAAAQTSPQTILFVGNSFVHGAFDPVLSYRAGVTDENAGLPADDPRAEKQGGKPAGPFGGVAAIFKRFTQEAGLAYDVHVELVSGMPLEYHYDHALPIIAQPKWDIVVLQELSTGPVLTTKLGSPANFARYTSLLESAVHHANPAANVLLYETFPRADLTFPDGAPFAGKPITFMGNALHDAYYHEFATEGHLAGVAPGGDAWLRAIAEGIAEPNPYAPEAGKVDLWNVDNYHPSTWAAYLAACVLFEKITGRDARTLGSNERAAADLGITPAQAQTAQRVANETILAAP